MPSVLTFTVILLRKEGWRGGGGGGLLQTQSPDGGLIRAFTICVVLIFVLMLNWMLFFKY